MPRHGRPSSGAAEASAVQAELHSDASHVSSASAPQITTLNCAVCARNEGAVAMTHYPHAAGWGTADAAAHERRMRTDLPAAVAAMVEDADAAVRLLLHACADV